MMAINKTRLGYRSRLPYPKISLRTRKSKKIVCGKPTEIEKKEDENRIKKAKNRRWCHCRCEICDRVIYSIDFNSQIDGIRE